jgi:hypothetical protein
VLGATVIGGAVAAVVVIAMSGEPPPAQVRTPVEKKAPEASPKPKVESLATPAGPAASMVVIEVASAPPRAQVYLLGSDVARCTTPCRLSIDPSDGGSPTERKFIVRADGHVDEPVTIVLGSAPPSLLVELEPLDERPEGSSSSSSSSRRRHESKTDPKVEPVPEVEPEPEPEPEPEHEHETKVEPEPKVEKKKKIDKTDTVNPFDP